MEEWRNLYLELRDIFETAEIKILFIVKLSVCEQLLMVI